MLCARVHRTTWDFQDGAVVKRPPADAGDSRDAVSIPGSGRSPAEGNGNPLQCSCLGNSMDGGAWRTRVCGLTKELDTIEPLGVSTHSSTHTRLL